MAAPLDGIRVLDFTRVVSGPSCTKSLVDLGAEVIKLEPPVGDMTRTAHPRVDGIPAYFAQQNTGKECISIDLAATAGSDLAGRLAATADVVVENFRPGVMSKYGLDYEALRQNNPGLIYCAITGYGQDGPDTERRAYAPMIHAEIGLLDLIARRRNGPVANEVASWADLQAGLQAALAIVAALRHRDLTGEGQFIDVTMAEVVLQMTEWTAVEWAGGEGDGLAIFGPVNAPVLTLGDGSRAVIPGDPVSSWERWMGAVDDAAVADHPLLLTRRSRADNRAAMMTELNRWAATIPDFEALEEVMSVNGLAAGRVRSISDVPEADWAVHRDAVVDVGSDEPLLLPRSPVRFSTLEAGTRGRPVHQGAHNHAVLGQLGLSADEIATLEADGVLIERPI